MVKKLTDRSIEDALSLGRRNQQTHRYLNWCKHLTIKTLSQSPVGQAFNLPIGMHEIYCDYFTGHQSVNVELIAQSFIEEHCADCRFHQEIHADNEGRAIVNKVRERRNRLHPALEARNKLKALVPDVGPNLVLEQGVNSDHRLRQLLHLLEDSERKTPAILKLLHVAQDLDIELFNISNVQILTTYLADPAIGEKVVQILRFVCARKPTMYRVVLEPSAYVFVDGYQREAVAYLLGDCVNALGQTTGVAELLPLLMDHHTSMMGIPTHRPSKGATHAIQTILKCDPGLVIQAAELELRRGDKLSRLRACDALDIVIGTTPELGQGVVDHLLQSLLFEEDMYERSADGVTIVLLAKIVQADLAQTMPKVERFFENAAPEVKALVLRVMERVLEAETDVDFQDRHILRAIHALIAGVEPAEVLLAYAGLLEHVSYRRPELLVKRTESLISALAFQASRPAEIRKEQAQGVLDGLKREQRAAEWARIVSSLRKAIEQVGRYQPETVANLVMAAIRNTNSATSAELKGDLIEILGELSRRHLSVAQSAIPLLFGLLVDNDSPRVRGNAAQALGELTNYRKGILPQDVLDLLRQLLLHETNVYVLTKLFRAFKQIRIADGNYALTICNALIGWEASFDEAYQQELIVDALLGIARRFDRLRPAVKPWFWRYCHHAEYWTRRHKLEEWFRWSREYPEYTLAEFVAATLQFYRDFPAETRDFNGLEQPYADLMSVPRQHFSDHVETIVQLCKSNPDKQSWRIRDFARLLSLKEYYELSSDLYHYAVQVFPEEPRFNKLRAYFEMLAHKDAAEAALMSGDVSYALESIDSACRLANDANDLEETQIGLRAKLLHCLTSFDLANVEAFAIEIEEVRRQYSIQLGKHQAEILDIDENYFKSLDHLLAILTLLCRWAEARLRAEENPNRYLEASYQHAELGAFFSQQSDSTLYSERLLDLHPKLLALNRISEIPALVLELALIPHPLIPEYRVKANWNGAKSRQRLLASEGIEQVSEEVEQGPKPDEVDVAQISISVDGQELTQPVTLIAGVAHGLRVELQFARWPERYKHLHLRFFSTSSIVSSLTIQPVNRPENFDGHITVDSHLVFEHPLSPAAPPIEANLVVSLVAEVEEQVLDLFGLSRLTAIVTDRPTDIMRDAASPEFFWERIEPRLVAIEAELQIGIQDLKAGQAAIYRHIDAAFKQPLAVILDWIRAGHMAQGEMAQTLDAIRRALRAMQAKNDMSAIQNSLDSLAVAVESRLGLQQKLELTLPLIPMFLNYKVELGAGSDLDLNQLKDELVELWGVLFAHATSSETVSGGHN